MTVRDDVQTLAGRCVICPRRCGVDRSGGERGVCGVPSEFTVSRIALHPWEEPPISGTRGSGTVFFAGCNLRCVFCQNRTISREGVGSVISEDDLICRMLTLQEEGAHNINLVTPTHFSQEIAKALSLVRHRLSIPVIYNTSGYERVESLSRLEGLVDAYLPDFKYYASDLSARYSGAADYRQVAQAALMEMYRQVGDFTLDEAGLLRSGILLRHLVLPGNRHDSMAVLDLVAELLPPSRIRVSIMSQYTPEFAMDCPFPELHRRVTRFEYESVVEHALSLGFTGYMQGRDSASAIYTPKF